MGWGRAYFAVQAVAGAAWWLGVFNSAFVREATLGGLDPVAVAIFDIPLFVIASAVAAFGVRAAALIATGWTIVVAVALAAYATITTEAGWGVLIMAAAAGASIIALCLLLLGRVPLEWIVRGPFAFRPASLRPGSAGYVASTLVQIVCFSGCLLVVVPFVLVLLERRWQMGLAFPQLAWVAGVALLLLANALSLSSAFVMSTRGKGTPLPSAMPNRLVVAGPYRWVRNPMAIGGIVQGVGVGLLLSSWLVVAYAIIGSVLWNYAVRPSEEADLEKRFGAEFQQYRQAVRCWIPRLPR